jgi:ABC-2 type transport system ATP-binding protein
MRYRLGLAQALLGAPDLLLLDEPTTGLDPAHILAVRKAITGAVEGGTTVLFSSHVMTDVEQICTHVAVIRDGRTVAAGPVSDVIARAGARSLGEAYLGMVQ